MQSLTTAEFKTVLDICLIGCSTLSTQNLCSSITLITEQRMPDMFHVGTNLMRTSSLQTTLHQGHITKTLQNLIMSNRTLSYL